MISSGAAQEARGPAAGRAEPPNPLAAPGRAEGTRPGHRRSSDSSWAGRSRCHAPTAAVTKQSCPQKGATATLGVPIRLPCGVAARRSRCQHPALAARCPVRCASGAKPGVPVVPFRSPPVRGAAARLPARTSGSRCPLPAAGAAPAPPPGASPGAAPRRPPVPPRTAPSRALPTEHGGPERRGSAAAAAAAPAPSPGAAAAAASAQPGAAAQGRELGGGGGGAGSAEGPRGAAGAGFAPDFRLALPARLPAAHTPAPGAWAGAVWPAGGMRDVPIGGGAAGPRG